VRTCVIFHVVFSVASAATFAFGQREESSSPVATIGELWNKTYRSELERIDRQHDAYGVNRCAACHDGKLTISNPQTLGNECGRWKANDQGRHFLAYRVLSEEKSNLMAKIVFQSDKPAAEQPQCLACHTVNVPEQQRLDDFKLEDNGVSCESCHGRSEKWIGDHQNPKAWRRQPEEGKRALGYYDLRDLVRRTEKCLECHLGTQDPMKRVTHEMLAAGHPLLTFELVTDIGELGDESNYGIPKHWDDKFRFEQENRGEDQKSFNARAWAVGQAVALRESVYMLGQWAESDAPVDFSLLECYACHHDLRNDGVRQKRGFVATPGQPIWDAFRWAMCKPLVREFLPEKAEDFERAGRLIEQVVTLNGSRRSEVRAAAIDLAGIADQLAEKVNETVFEREHAVKLIRAFATDPSFGRIGYRAAVQVYHALDHLHGVAFALPSASAPSSEFRKSMAALHDMLYRLDNDAKKLRESPERFDPVAYQKALESVANQSGNPSSR